MNQPISLFDYARKKEPAYATLELLAYNLALELRDGEVVLTGANNALPVAACRLAQLLHAPNLSFIGGGGGSVNSLVEPLSPASCDYSYLAAETVLPLPEMIMLQGRPGFVNTFFAGGMQVDQYGNCNLSSIGPDWHKPLLRGPGAASLPFMGRFGRTIIYVAAHTTRIFVPKVDFVTGPGFLSGPDDYRRAQRSYTVEGVEYQRTQPLTSTGPALVATPLALLDFEPDSLCLRLRSVHPNVTVKEVQAATGFELVIPTNVPTTPTPPAEVVKLIRSFDTEGVLRQ